MKTLSTAIALGLWIFFYFVFGVYNKNFDYRAWSSDSAGAWAFLMVFSAVVLCVALVVIHHEDQIKRND